VEIFFEKSFGGEGGCLREFREFSEFKEFNEFSDAPTNFA
jgi:hypothetical protein